MACVASRGNHEALTDLAGSLPRGSCRSPYQLDERNHYRQRQPADSQLDPERSLS